MAHRAEVSDRILLLLDDEEESCENFFGWPLAQFIKLAATDSGMDPSQTSDLLVKVIHPLFLKAKAAASKHDNPSWKQAMSGQFADEFWKAAVTEFRTLEDRGAWEVVDSPLFTKVLDIIWAFNIKWFSDVWIQVL